MPFYSSSTDHDKVAPGINSINSGGFDMGGHDAAAEDEVDDLETSLVLERLQEDMETEGVNCSN